MSRETRKSPRLNPKNQQEDEPQQIQEDVPTKRNRVNKKLLEERRTKQKHDKPAKEIQEDLEEEESQHIEK
ncbi:hypothetical protein MKW98_017448, partial [Papaver atlanticum]